MGGWDRGDTWNPRPLEQSAASWLLQQDPETGSNWPEVTQQLCGRAGNQFPDSLQGFSTHQRREEPLRWPRVKAIASHPSHWEVLITWPRVDGADWLTQSPHTTPSLSQWLVQRWPRDPVLAIKTQKSLGGANGDRPSWCPFGLFCLFLSPLHVLNWPSVSGGEQLPRDLEDNSQTLRMAEQKDTRSLDSQGNFWVTITVQDFLPLNIYQHNKNETLICLSHCSSGFFSLATKWNS